MSKPHGTSINGDHAAEAHDIASNYVAACRSVSADSIEAVASKRKRLEGWMHYCRQAEFGPAKVLRQQLDAGDRHVKRRLRSLSINSRKNKWWVVNIKQKRNEPRRIARIWKSREAAVSAKSSSKSTGAVAACGV